MTHAHTKPLNKNYLSALESLQGQWYKTHSYAGEQLSFPQKRPEKPSKPIWLCFQTANYHTQEEDIQNPHIPQQRTFTNKTGLYFPEGEVDLLTPPLDFDKETGEAQIPVSDSMLKLYEQKFSIYNNFTLLPTTNEQASVAIKRDLKICLTPTSQPDEYGRPLVLTKIDVRQNSELFITDQQPYRPQPNTFFKWLYKLGILENPYIHHRVSESRGQGLVSPVSRNNHKALAQFSRSQHRVHASNISYDISRNLKPSPAYLAKVAECLMAKNYTSPYMGKPLTTEPSILNYGAHSNTQINPEILQARKSSFNFLHIDFNTTNNCINNIDPQIAFEIPTPNFTQFIDPKTKKFIATPHSIKNNQELFYPFYLLFGFIALSCVTKIIYSLFFKEEETVIESPLHPTLPFEINEEAMQIPAECCSVPEDLDMYIEEASAEGINAQENTPPNNSSDRHQQSLDR